MIVQAFFTKIVGAVAGNPLLERLVVASIELIVVTAVVLAVIHIARIRASRVVSLLWLVVLAKPVLSLAFGAPAPLFDLENPAVVKSPLQAVSPAAEPGGAGAVALLRGVARSGNDPVRLNEAGGSGRSDVTRFLPVLWLAGAGLLTLLSVRDRLRIRGIAAASAAPDERIAALYREAAGGRGDARLPELYVTDQLESPAIAGSVRPVVFLPAWMTHSPDRERVLWSLRHELTHWRHRDPLAGFVREVARILFFFHPLVWWAGRRWKEASEVACDQAMVDTRRDARRYAEQLYHILARVHSRRQIMITSGLFATRTQIGKRIELLLKNRPLAANGRKLPAAVFLALFAALTLSLGAEIKPQADPHEVYIKSGGNKGRTVTATITEHDGDAERTITITTRGDVEFNNRRTDVESVSEGGEFFLVSTYDREKRELRVTADDEGNLQRVYEVDGKTHAFDDDAGEWLADCLDRIDGDDEFITISKPGVKFYKGRAHPSRIRVEVIEPPDPPGVPERLKMIADGARVLSVTRDDDDSETIDIFIHEDDGNSVILRSDGNTLRARDGRMKLKISPDTKVLIQIDRDGDIHQLEIRSGKDGKREYLYKINGEEKPYDEDAKEIFRDYIEEYEDIIGIPKGEKI